MTKTMGVLLGLALVWLAAWSIASWSCYSSGREQLAEADSVRTPTTTLEPGADVRVEGTLISAPTVKASFSERPCLAAHTVISAWSRYRDSQDQEWTDSAVIKELRVGPENLEIAVGDARIQLPLALWVSRDRIFENVGVLPPRLGVTEADIEAAKAQLRGSFQTYTVAERTLDGGAHVFIVGKLEAGDGPLRLEADRGLERVELFIGTQADYVKELERGGGTLQLLAWIFGPIGLPPILIVGAVLLVRRLRRRPS